MDAIAIRDVLRNDYSDDLDRRRKIICLSAIGLLISASFLYIKQE